MILGFDTSGPWLSAALEGGSGHDPTHHRAMSRGQAEALMPALEALLEEGSTSWADLAAVAVGVGPGNFTGQRVAVAAARGLSFALGIPAVGVSAFEAFDPGGHESDRLLISLPAPRGEAYVQVFIHGHPISDPIGTSLDAPPSALRQAGLVVVGHEAERLAAALGAEADPLPWARRDEEMIGAEIARIGADKLRRRGASHFAPPAPLYVRPPDAAPGPAAPRVA